jgi:aldehyde:ferredoxin oxidoreductase
MAFGHWGKALRVNLTTGSLTTETLDDTFLRRYVGGWGFIAYYMLKELAPGIDPLGPENKVIFTTGPLTGQPLAGGGRSMVGGKSPLTGGFGAAESGGFFGAELKRAGWDTVIVEGVSPEPVYLWIKDDQVELRSAAHLWGHDTYDVQAQIREDLGDNGIRVAQCGPAGERLVRYANVMHDATRAAGRTGLGAVMGSKKFRAIAVRGSQRPPTAEQDKLTELGRWFRENYKTTGSGIFSTTSTVRMTRVLNGMGGLPTRNFQEGVFEGFENLTAEAQLAKYTIDRDTCFGCPVRCKWVVEVKEGPYRVDPKYGGPEYESIGAFGFCCGIDDLAAVNLANQLCNAAGLDTISAGATIAFAMECFERGLIGTQDTDGLELRFGNTEAMLEMLRRMIARQGFGDLLAEGSKRAAEHIGQGAIAYAIQQKGQEVAMHDPRVKYGHGLGFAVSPTGADHMHSVHDSGYASKGGIADLEPMGILEPLPFDDLSTAKMRMVRYAMISRVVHNLTGTCMFHAWTTQQRSDLVAAATGWETSFMELWLAAERAYDMARAFNAREGFGPEDDRIHPRFTQALPKGAVAGKAATPEQYAAATIKFYELMGWDSATACPTRAKLEDLGVGWVADRVEEARR